MGGIYVLPLIFAKKNNVNQTFWFNLRCHWCGRQELNLHGVTHKILSLARLPVPPRPRLTHIIIYQRRAFVNLFYRFSRKKFIFFIFLLHRENSVCIFLPLSTHNICKWRNFYESNRNCQKNRRARQSGYPQRNPPNAPHQRGRPPRNFYRPRRANAQKIFAYRYARTVQQSYRPFA